MMTEDKRQKSFTELELEQQRTDWAKAYAAVQRATIDGDGDSWKQDDIEQQLAASIELPPILIRQCLWELAREGIVRFAIGGLIVRRRLR